MPRLSLTFFSLIYLLFVPGIGAAQTEADFFNAPPVLQGGDLIRIEVWRQPELSGEFEITGAGTIAHPQLSALQVAGRDVSSVEEDLRLFLLNFQADPDFVVEGYFQVVVGGQVRSPDVYPLRPGTSVARAIALAGGPTDRGDMSKVIIRRGEEAYTFDLVSENIRFREMPVRSGDEIVVMRTRDLFRDFIAPSASVVAAVATVLNLIF